MFPRMPMINGLMGPNQQRFPINQGAGPCMPDSFPPLNRMPFTDNPRYCTALSNVIFFFYLCFFLLQYGMNGDELSFVVIIGIKSSIKCLKKQLGHGPPLHMSLALHHLDHCLRERLKPCQMPKGVHLNGKKRRHLESLPLLHLFYTPMSISPT